MGLSLLAPLFLAGLAAVAVPVLVHLSARDRRDVLRFPSLRFLTRLPYRQAKRQRLRHRLLFAVRTLAVVLLVLAFTRPLLDVGSAVAFAGSGREVVIAVDRSYSMAYAGIWERALRAARAAISGAPAGSRLSLLGFAEEATVEVAPTTNRQSVLDALEDLAPGSGSTRFGPVLRLADEILLDSPRLERGVVLISDLQATGWDRSADAGGTVLSPGVELTTPTLRDDPEGSEQGVASDVRRDNVLVADAVMRQSREGARESRPSRDGGYQATIAARLVNAATDGPPVTVTASAAIGDAASPVETSVHLPPAQSTTVRLGPLDLPADIARVTVRLGDDPLPADNAFYLTAAPRVATPVLLIEAPDARPEASLYLREALAVAAADPGTEADLSDTSGAPAFELEVKRATSVTPEDVTASSVVVIHDSSFPGGATGRAIADHVAGGGGLWVILGSRSRPPNEDLAALLPGTWRESVDRLEGRGVGLAAIDYRHPVFEIFAGPGDGNLAAPRVYRYRPIDLDAENGAIAVARTSDGAVALAEHPAGKGQVLLWGSPFDNRWSDLPVQAVFLPFVHQACRYLAGEREIPPWHRVGQVLDLRALAASIGVEEPGAGVIVETPSGRRREVALDRPFALREAGFYDVTLSGPEGDLTWPVAVNVDSAESDLTPLDPRAFVAASTTVASGPAAPMSRSLGREQRERRQGMWWFLMLAALLVLATESPWSNRLARERAES